MRYFCTQAYVESALVPLIGSVTGWTQFNGNMSPATLIAKPAKGPIKVIRGLDGAIYWVRQPDRPMSPFRLWYFPDVDPLQSEMLIANFKLTVMQLTS